MIHKIQLPEETKSKLCEVVRLQMALLTYAATQSSLDPDLTADFINRYRVFHGRGREIVKALRGGNSGDQNSKRWQLLEKFATNRDGLDFLSPIRLMMEKVQVVRLMKCDVYRLWQGSVNVGMSFFMDVRKSTIFLPDNLISTRQFAEANVRREQKCKFPGWLCAAQEFLISFYEWLNPQIPGNLFHNGQSYSRQTALRVFSEQNPKHYVCAICDEHSFRTIYDGHHLSDLEHYFPKTIYPHLACHPYNLVPICGACNQVHNDRDPLYDVATGKRRTLGDVFLPYREQALDKNVAISVVGEEDANVQLSLDIVDSTQIDDFCMKLVVLGEVYKIPIRWQDKRDEIEDHLWRRIRQFLADDVAVIDALDSKEYIQRKMHRLLAYFEDDLGRDPLAFPGLWLLANLVVTELDAWGGSSSEQSPFLSEVASWTRSDPDRITKLEQRSDDLRRIVADLHARKAHTII